MINVETGRLIDRDKLFVAVLLITMHNWLKCFEFLLNFRMREFLQEIHS